jgi:hypothetical protein
LAEVSKAFEFKQCVSIIKSTGKKAKNLRELREILSHVSLESIFHHTYQYFLKGHILEYTNDFAQWAGESLEERALAEHLSNIDPYNYKDIHLLREELLRVVDDYLHGFPEPREAMAGDEFFFNETVTLTFPVGIKAHNLAQFLIGVKYVDTGSIYYHFYEARMRLGGGIDDFSAWVEAVLGKHELSARIGAIDPFMHSIEGIRDHILVAVEEEVKKDMELIH